MSDEYYTVEKIIDKQKKGKRTMYLVKWEGFLETEATWEPMSNLLNVRDMVKAFELKSNAAKNLSLANKLNEEAEKIEKDHKNNSEKKQPPPPSK